MRLPNTAHTSRPWRIHELTHDFRLEDVWALPGVGGPDDFPRLVQQIASFDPSQSSSCAVRTLFVIRRKLGELLGWDDADAGLGSRVPTLRDRLPADPRDGPSCPEFDARPFTSPYLTDDDWAAELATLPRRELTADFHCVAGWSATDLHWEGVAFETFYRMIIEPSLQPDTSVTHVVFGGLDGYRSVVSIEDALAEDVLIAERLDGRPLDGDHGAPARLVSPNQYGFMSTKHLCRIELHTAEPAANYHPSPIIQLGLQLVKPHRRARVWQEERHRYLPAWSVRRVYRLLIPVIAFLCSRGSRPLENHEVTDH